MNTDTNTVEPIDGPDSLGQRYRAAVLDRSVGLEEYQTRLSAIEQEIFAACGGEERGWRFISTITNEIDAEAETEQGRDRLRSALDAAGEAITEIEAALRQLTGVYDVEIAEGNSDLHAAALTNMRLNLAALRHETRNATAGIR